MKAWGRWRPSGAQVLEYLQLRNTDVGNPFIPLAPVLLEPWILRPVKLRTALQSDQCWHTSAWDFLERTTRTCAAPRRQSGPEASGMDQLPCTCAAQMLRAGAVNLPSSQAWALRAPTDATVHVQGVTP